MTIASLCMLAALCEQLLGGSRLFGAVRLALGLEIAGVAVALLEGLVRMLN